MSATETINLAVRKLEELIESIPAAPWVYRYDGGDEIQVQADTALASDGGMYDSEDMIYERDGMDGLYDTSIDLGRQGKRVVSTANYIATMDPTVARSISAWLKDEAAKPTPSPYAVMVATAVNLDAEKL